MADEDEEMNVDGGPVEGRDENDENEEGPREEITAEEVRRAIRAGQFVRLFSSPLMIHPPTHTDLFE